MLDATISDIVHCEWHNTEELERKEQCVPAIGYLKKESKRENGGNESTGD